MVSIGPGYNLLDFEIKKLKIIDIEQLSNSILIKQNSLDFKSADNITVILKNVKTREECICASSINSNNLMIELNSLAHHFSNYEGSIYIVIQTCNDISIYTPIINTSYKIKPYINDKCDHNWYLRILDNGELRLSSVIIK